MTIKELISELKTYNPKANVTFAIESGDLEILSIYSCNLSDKTRMSIFVEENLISDPDVCIDLGEIE